MRWLAFAAVWIGCRASVDPPREHVGAQHGHQPDFRDPVGREISQETLPRQYVILTHGAESCATSR